RARLRLDTLAEGCGRLVSCIDRVLAPDREVLAGDLVGNVKSGRVRPLEAGIRLYPRGQCGGRDRTDHGGRYKRDGGPPRADGRDPAHRSNLPRVAPRTWRTLGIRFNLVKTAAQRQQRRAGPLQLLEQHRGDHDRPGDDLLIRRLDAADRESVLQHTEDEDADDRPADAPDSAAERGSAQ